MSATRAAFVLSSFLLVGCPLMRFGFVATQTEDLYTATVSETGGDVDTANGCVYWIT